MLGAPIHAAVNIQEKENVLLVPKQAIRTVGARSYVEVSEGGRRRSATVEVGLIAGDKAEILSGLREGQAVVVRS